MYSYFFITITIDGGTDTVLSNSNVPENKFLPRLYHQF